jgi:type IV pilus assembly protein PilA
MKNQKGFSLIELLVVVIIIAIIAAIAIPSLLASRRAANESSAIGSLRTISSAQHTYLATNGSGATPPTYAAALTDLSGDGLIDTALSSGSKSGYDFTLTPGAGASASSLYCVSADPTTPGTSGDRFFGTNQTGMINAHTATVTCAAATQNSMNGTPIQ